MKREIKPYAFKMGVVEGFRYRVEDVLKSVTRHQIKEARLAELKNEIVNSEKLKSFFEDNPKDLALLKHEKTLLEAQVRPHLKFIPSYLINSAALSSSSSSTTTTTTSSGGDGKGKKSQNQEQSFTKKRKSSDPLKTFSVKKSK
eukprot:TRINITY_DN1148_c0_g1_i1.p1 TRINITY_DN1148_c0_g1~~TRINITY_DN1148_c0_g1_i1.p1  ORF type:complete len:144 (-),score=55.85 TRINITY_DN1148_c0_g1_i1:90-521(-)